MTNWRKLALDNEDKIKEKMREAYKESIGSITDSWQYSVILDEDGDAEVHFLSQNSTTTGIFNGEAIEICHFQRFSLDNMDIDWNLENWLDDEEKCFYIEWQDATSGTEDIEEWNEEIFERVEKQRKEDFIAEYMNENIEEAWDGFFEMLNNNEY